MAKTDLDFRSQLTKIKNSSPDGLFVSITGPKQIGLVIKQARELGLDVQLVFPNETVEDQQVIEIAGSAADGLLYIMPGNPPDTPKYRELKARYKEKFGEDELPQYVTEAYDAVMLGVKAILASNGTKEGIKNKLYEVSKTYEGVSGNVEFDDNGDVHKEVIIKTVKGGEFVLYK